MNFVHKTEFAMTDKGVRPDWEFKFRKDKANVAGSILCNTKKAEVEFEYEPLGLKTAESFLKLRLKESLSTNPNPNDPAAANKLWPYMRYWNMETEGEAKFTFTPELGHTLKLNYDGKTMVPKAKFTTLFNRKPWLMGVNYNFDFGHPKYTNLLEVLLGGNPYKNFTTYIKHAVAGFNYPGLLTVGLHDKETFEMNWDKKTKNGTKNKAYRCPAEFALEASTDLTKVTDAFSARGAFKISSGPKYTIQMMCDSAFRIGSAFTYVPKRGFKFIWSDQIDAKTLITNPQKFEYAYGFTFELGL